MNPADFELVMEVYSYELLSSNTTYILQSVRKLAKHLSELAPFKRSSATAASTLPHQHQQLSVAQASNAAPYSYSMHKFRLVANSTLTPSDVAGQAQTKMLQILPYSGINFF